MTLNIQINNPFYDRLSETIPMPSMLFGSEMPKAYSSGLITGAFTRDSDSQLIRDLAEYDITACIDILGGERSAIYEESELGQPNRIRSSENVDHWYPWIDYLFEDPKRAMKGKQLQGDCTTWAVRLLLQFLRMERMKDGHLERYYKRISTVPYYANRGFMGQGSNPTRQLTLASQIGYVFEEKYGKYDLTNYETSYKLGTSWGRQMPPSEITDVSSAYRPGKVKLIRSLEGWLDANRKRYPWLLGSSMGVSDRGNPISALQGSWGHAMGGAGFDERPWIKEKLGVDVVAFMDQSWGVWNRVTNIPQEWLPFGEGMFVLNYRSLERYIVNGECLCIVPEESQGIPYPEPSFLTTHSNVIKSGDVVYETRIDNGIPYKHPVGVIS